MKKLKENFLALLGIIALSLALVTFYAPSDTYAGGGKRQWVSTDCAGHPCNDCNVGSNTCTDHICSQCIPDPEQ